MLFQMTELPISFFISFAAIFGLIFGSFANVLIWRIPRSESIVKPGSHCTNCHHELSWYENIPVVSYILLRARCKSCHQSISFRYPLVEIITAIVSVWGVIAWQGDFGRQISAVLLAPLLIALTYIDIDHMELPDALVVAVGIVNIFGILFTGGKAMLPQFLSVAAVFLLLATIWRWLLHSTDAGSEPDKSDDLPEPTIKERWVWGGGALLLGVVALLGGLYGSMEISDWNALWGFFTGGGALLSLWGLFLFLQGREAVGLGDMKLMAVMGIVVGPGRILFAYIIGAICGIFVWLFLRLRRNHQTSQPFPFGPSLIIGSWIAWLHGEWLLQTYTKYLL